MHNQHSITGISVLLAFMMSFSTFANGNGSTQSVVIGEAPGGRVTSSVEKTKSAVSLDLAPDSDATQDAITRAPEAATEPTAASRQTETTAASAKSAAVVTTVATKSTVTQTTVKATTTAISSKAETTTAKPQATTAETTTAKPQATTAETTTAKPQATTAETEKAVTTTAKPQATTAKTETTTTEPETETTAESKAVQTVKANASFRPVRSAITSSANEAGPGVKTTTAAETTEAESETDKLRREIVDFALKHVGVRYRWGGANLAKGVDCSGLTSEIYKRFGISIGRTSRDQANRGRTIPLDQIKPGDLLIYKDHTGYINHVTMYLGNGKLINASSENTGVIISDIGYRTPLKAVRFIQD